MNFEMHRIPKDKKVNKFWRESFDQHSVKFENQACLREREAYNNKSNVLVQRSSNSRLDNYADPCP